MQVISFCFKRSKFLRASIIKKKKARVKNLAWITVFEFMVFLLNKVRSQHISYTYWTQFIIVFYNILLSDHRCTSQAYIYHVGSSLVSSRNRVCSHMYVNPYTFSQEGQFCGTRPTVWRRYWRVSGSIGLAWVGSSQGAKPVSPVLV